MKSPIEHRIKVLSDKFTQVNNKLLELNNKANLIINQIHCIQTSTIQEFKYIKRYLSQIV